MKYFILFLLCLSCGGDDFRKVEKLDGFRVLGIFADKPEVAPDDIVGVKVLITDVNGIEGTIDGSYEVCIDPGISRGASVSCSHDPTKISDSFDIGIAGLLPNDQFRTGLSGETLTLTVPGEGSIFYGRSDREKFNGVGYLVIFTFNVNNLTYKAFKRIIVTNRGSYNNNPSGSSLLLNGSPVSQAPVDGDELSVTSSIPESYSVKNIDGVQENRTEKYELAWYTSSGKFSSSKTSIDETVDYEGEEPSSLTIALIRDERGGLDFVKASYP
jgi:hypothetical protein